MAVITGHDHAVVMSVLHSILSQYLLETAALGALLLATLYPLVKRRDPRKALGVIAGLNVLRFGGVAGALAATAASAQPAFLYTVALGDGMAAALAVIACVALARRSSRAPLAVTAMNVVGLAGILVSETWLQCLQLAGDIPRSAGVHGPTMGAACFTVAHLLAFALVRAGGLRAPGSATQSA